VAAFAILYAAANVGLAAHIGVQIGGDSSRYIVGGAAMLDGRLSDGPPGYRGYEAVIALFDWLRLGLPGVVALQILAASCSLVALYSMGRRLFDERAGLASVAFHCANVDAARWHSYVLTDSLYTSGLVLTVWAAHRAMHPSGGPRIAGARRYGLAALALVATASVRPEGIVLVTVVIGYWITRALQSGTRRRVPLLILVLVGTAGVAGLAADSAIRYGTGLATDASLLRQGVVVYGYDGWRVRMASEAGPDARPGGSASYVLRHPVAYMRLALARVGAEIAHVRPFHSTRHNTVIVLALIPVYGLGLAGTLRARDRSLARLIVAVIAGHLAIVAVTFADWDGRFLSHVLPLVTALAAAGVAAVSSGWNGLLDVARRAQPRGRIPD
jgi:4-amino-4-deoxy-L-arabinose transferase-like glycosyltransferase